MYPPREGPQPNPVFPIHSRLPSIDFTRTATFADDTSILANNPDPEIASQYLQFILLLVQEWCHRWRVRINEAKFTHITFTFKRYICPPGKLNDVDLPQAEVKYSNSTWTMTGLAIARLGQMHTTWNKSEEYVLAGFLRDCSSPHETTSCSKNSSLSLCGLMECSCQ